MIRPENKAVSDLIRLLQHVQEGKEINEKLDFSHSRPGDSAVPVMLGDAVEIRWRQYQACLKLKHRDHTLR